MKAVFFTYLAARLRLFVSEILQLHQRFLVVFIYIFGLLLSGNEQAAIKDRLAHLGMQTPWSESDLWLTLLLVLFCLITAAVIRHSARGGRVHFLVESLPLPMSWERGIRIAELSLLNLSVFFMFMMGLGAISKQGGSLVVGVLHFAGLYALLLGLQLALLERRWRMIPLWMLSSFVLVWGRGTAAGPWFLLLVFIGFGFSLRQAEARIHENPGLAIGDLRARLRSWITRRIPPQLLMPFIYSITRPAMLIYCLFFAGVLYTLMILVLKNPIPMTQRIHVYTCISGFLVLLFSSFFRLFHQTRNEWLTWLESLPRLPSYWNKQDYILVLALFLLPTLPITALVVIRGDLPLAVALFILAAHLLNLEVLARIHRSQLAQGIILGIGYLLWLLFLGYLCDHSLRGILG